MNIVMRTFTRGCTRSVLTSGLVALGLIALIGCGGSSGGGGSGTDDTTSTDTTDPPADTTVSDDTATTDDTTAPPDDTTPPPDDTTPPDGEGCCKASDDCNDGQVCAVGNEGENGGCAEGLKDGECYADSDCGDKATCEGAVFCPCETPCVQGTAPGQCKDVVTPPCCTSDKDCPDKTVCTTIVGGTCINTPAQGDCWTDQQCADDETCEGAFACPCAADCDQEDTLGKCEKKAEPPGGVGACCDIVTDQYPPCEDELACLVPAKETAGQCIKPLQSGECYDDKDCASGTCKNASICGCAANCVSAPGTCEDDKPPPGCCNSKTDCAAKQNCVGTPTGGVCKNPAPDGACWSDTDCPNQKSCVGASVCPCGAQCFAPDTFGLCTDLTPPGGLCCADDGQCTVGQTCAVAQGQTNGTCQTAITFNQCYNDSHCNGGTCNGASLCPCNALCILPTLPGTCGPPVPTLPGCCSKSSECANGQTCLDIPGTGPFASKGICVQIPLTGKCWTKADCIAGMACDGAITCPCGAFCAKPNIPGDCTNKPK